jgi:hypothetical protein
VLFLKNRKFVQSGVTAFKQRMLLLFPMVHEDLFSFGTHHQKFTSFLALKRSWWRGEEEEEDG